jgi:hypothetical protein
VTVTAPVGLSVGGQRKLVVRNHIIRQLDVTTYPGHGLAAPDRSGGASTIMDVA